MRLANAVGGPVCQNASRIEEHNRSQWARAAHRLGNIGSSNETLVSHTTTLLKSLPQQDWSKNAYWGPVMQPSRAGLVAGYCPSQAVSGDLKITARVISNHMYIIRVLSARVWASNRA